MFCNGLYHWICLSKTPWKLCWLSTSNGISSWSMKQNQFFIFVVQRQWITGYKWYNKWKPFLKTKKKMIQMITNSLPIVVKVKHRWELILKVRAYWNNFQAEMLRHYLLKLEDYNEGQYLISFRKTHWFRWYDCYPNIFQDHFILDMKKETEATVRVAISTTACQGEVKLWWEACFRQEKNMYPG